MECWKLQQKRIFYFVNAVLLWSAESYSVSVDARGELRQSEGLLRRDSQFTNRTGNGGTPLKPKALLEVWTLGGALNHSHETPESLRTAEKERHAMSTLTYVWFPMAAVMAILFEAFHLRWAEVDWSLPLDRSDGREGSEKVDSSFRGLTLRLAQRGCHLAWIYFAGAGRVKGRCYLILLVWIHLVGMYLELLTFDFQKRYWNLYQQPSLPLFFELIRNWFILHITRMITYVYEFYVEDIFLLHWRDHLTRYFEAIWVPNTYVFKMKEGGKLDNPDQRIHVDTANFVTQTYSLTFGVMKMLLNLLMYSYMLMSITPTQMHPGSLVAIAFLYSALGSMTIHLMGSKLAHFSWLGERCGGDFRSELRRVYDQCESVASFRSDEAELCRLQHRFERIKLNTWQTMLLEKRLAIVQKWYSPLREILFMCILAPFFITGVVSLGRLKQCEMALDRISDSFSFLVENYSNLSTYRAVVDRLYNFRSSCLAYLKSRKDERDGEDGSESNRKTELAIIERLAPLGIPPKWPPFWGGSSLEVLQIPPSPETDLSLDASIYLPSGDLLMEDVHIQVPRGSGVMICGEEGAGKSTILRAVAGMWPFVKRTDGRNDTQCTGGMADIFFIPQKPGLPSPMSLREAVSFPHSADHFRDEDIRDVLQRVGLEFAPGLDSKIDVNTTLSGGEFQRLMVAHCILAKPSFIFLDESMAHMSRANRLQMYKLLAELVQNGTGLLSTSHCWQELIQFHSEFYVIEVKKLEDGSFKRSLVPFRPSEHAEGDLCMQVNEKDKEIERLREEIIRFRKRSKQA